MVTTSARASSPAFLTKSAASLVAALHGETLRRAVDGLVRHRKILGAAGGGAALALVRPALDAMPTGYRYGKWSARLDDMVSSAVPSGEEAAPSTAGNPGADAIRGRV